MTRRAALSNGAKIVAGASIGAQMMAATGADAPFAQALRQAAETVRKPGYGKLRNHFEGIMSVPNGFHVTRFGAAGTKMSDGLPTPNFHDGTDDLRRRASTGSACCATRRATGIATTTRRSAPTTPTTARRAGRRDDHRSSTRRRASSSSSALVLNGTDNNCNGGTTPWGTWLSCEESMRRARTTGSRSRTATSSRSRSNARGVRRTRADQGHGPHGARGLRDRPQVPASST